MVLSSNSQKNGKLIETIKVSALWSNVKTFRRRVLYVYTSYELYRYETWRDVTLTATAFEKKNLMSYILSPVCILES